MCGLRRFCASPSPSVLVCKTERREVSAAWGGYEVACSWFNSSYENHSLPFAGVLAPAPPQRSLTPSLAENHRLCWKEGKAAAFPIPWFLQLGQSSPPFTHLYLHSTSHLHTLEVWGQGLYIQFLHFTQSFPHNGKHTLKKYLREKGANDLFQNYRSGNCNRFKGYLWKHAEALWHHHVMSSLSHGNL